jgi:arylsulfatase A-like enzyme
MELPAAFCFHDLLREKMKTKNVKLNFKFLPKVLKPKARCAAAIFCLLIFSCIARAADKPNILILLADDSGYADFGFNGSKIIKTPNLDRFAAQGIKLTDFRACPMCSPTRAGLMTGRYPIRFGMMKAVVPPWSKYGIPSEENTIAELLAKAGYEQRGIMGKWHLGHARKAFLPLENGFTFFYGHYNGAIDYFTHEREGELDWHLNEATSRDKGYSTDLIGNEAARLIHDAPAGKPWFLYVPFNATHSPFEAKESDMKKYSELKMPNRAYAAMVDSMDQAIGKILAAVDARKDAENTIVLFFSDNGGVPKVGSSNAPYRGHKLTVYEGGTRVAAAIRWPKGGLVGGKTFEGRIGYIDVLPTMLSVAGEKSPDNLDGINFLPALTGKEKLPKRSWFSYMDQNHNPQASVHLGDWKLIAYGDIFSENPTTPPKFELYNIKTDFMEKNNLGEKHPKIVAQLSKQLRDFGTWQNPGVGSYGEGREGFKAPKDWVITK